jgi:hypothetical protein
MPRQQVWLSSTASRVTAVPLPGRRGNVDENIDDAKPVPLKSVLLDHKRISFATNPIILYSSPYPDGPYPTVRWVSGGNT